MGYLLQAAFLQASQLLLKSDSSLSPCLVPDTLTLEIITFELHS